MTHFFRTYLSLDNSLRMPRSWTKLLQFIHSHFDCQRERMHNYIVSSWSSNNWHILRWVHTHGHPTVRSLVPERVPPPSKFNGYCRYLDCRAKESNRLPNRIYYSSEWTATARQLYKLRARSQINYLQWSLCSSLN